MVLVSAEKTGKPCIHTYPVNYNALVNIGIIIISYTLYLS